MRLAQSYSIDWHSVDGGGGASTGGVYSVTGSIGQSDAGEMMTGGGYSVTGGFWSLLPGRETGAPPVRIVLTATNTAVIYWPLSSTGFSLQQNADLNTTNWAAPSETDQQRRHKQIHHCQSACGQSVLPP